MFFSTLLGGSCEMNKTILFFGWMLLISCPLFAQTKNTERLEDSAYAVIESIPEVQELIKYDTGKVWRLSMRTIDRPREGFKYFWIQVGQISNVRFYPQHNFYVNPVNFDVFYKDTVSDSLFTLPQMRERDRRKLH